MPRKFNLKKLLEFYFRIFNQSFMAEFLDLNFHECVKKKKLENLFGQITARHRHNADHWADNLLLAGFASTQRTFRLASNRFLNALPMETMHATGKQCHVRVVVVVKTNAALANVHDGSRVGIIYC